MRIKRIAWRNISSYGNKVQRIDFENNPGFFMLTGDNATGKSSFLNCITFALYGKVTNKSLKDLANRKNKNAWVRIELEASQRNVVIERGISPNTFEVTVDGAVIGEAGKANIQKYLEDEIFKMPFYVFDNLISLNINDFKSFIDMTPSDKRAIIDRLFSLDIINQMRELLKADSRDVKNILDSVNKEITWIESSIQKSIEKRAEIEKKMKQDASEEIERLTLNAQHLEEESKEISIEDSKVKESYNNLSPKRSNLEEEVRKTKYTIDIKEKELTLFEKDSCPTCGREMELSFRESSKQSILAEIDSLKSNMLDKKNLLKEVNESIDKLKELNESIRERRINTQSSIKTIKSKIDFLENQGSKNEDVGVIAKLIEESEALLEEKQEIRTKAESKSSYIRVLDSILGDGGIKTMAIRNLLPVLNTYISDLSTEMGSEYAASFDEEFEAKLFHLGEEISPKTLSTGETKKLDIIVLVGLIKLMKMRFPELNILFLDEVFSSVDQGNVYHVIRILGKITRDMRLNTIVVNHAQLPHEEFDYILRTKKANGFSSIELEPVN
jgi:DNA repair exonuclease SbcCD ATPase subunit